MSPSGQTRPRRSPAAVTAIPPTPDSNAASHGDRSGPFATKVHRSKMTLFNHLVGERGQIDWNRQSEGFSGFGIDDQFELHRGLDG